MGAVYNMKCDVQVRSYLLFTSLQNYFQRFLEEIFLFKKYHLMSFIQSTLR